MIKDGTHTHTPTHLDTVSAGFLVSLTAAGSSDEAPRKLRWMAGTEKQVLLSALPIITKHGTGGVTRSFIKAENDSLFTPLNIQTRAKIIIFFNIVVVYLG